MYELIVIWETGERETYQYETKEAAEQGEKNYRMAFGNQISWTGIDHNPPRRQQI